MPKPPKFEGGGLSEGEGRFRTTGEQQLEDALSETAEATDRISPHTIARIQNFLTPISDKLCLDALRQPKFIFPQLQPHIISQKEVSEMLEFIESESDWTSPGTYLLSPEAVALNPVFSEVEFAEFDEIEKEKINREAWSIHDILKYIYKKYGDTHIIPGIEYQQWLTTHSESAPRLLSDGGRFWLPGSLFVSVEARWRILFAVLGNNRHDNPQAYDTGSKAITNTDLNLPFDRFLVLKRPKSD